MHVYRYRSPGLLSQKELIYDEWYFASKGELNDPIDMQSKFEFPRDSKNTWLRVVNSLFKNYTWADSIADYFNSICPISYEELIKNYEKHALAVVEFVFNGKNIHIQDIKTISELLEKLKELLSLYAPSAGYSVSLSNCNDDMLMWSHYGASHTGYCLIYRPINGYIYQDPIRCRDQLSVTKYHKCTIGNKFKVKSIYYENELESIDAFYLLPECNTGCKFDNEKERLEFHSKVEKQLLTKNECWGYEQEARLLLPQPNGYISGKSTYSACQRLFHYDFNQVVGIVFGALMKDDDKLIIKEILNEKLRKKVEAPNLTNGKVYTFDFLYQQAEICPSSRTIKIIDQELNSGGNIINIGNKHYDRNLKHWKEFKGITFESGKFINEEIP